MILSSIVENAFIVCCYKKKFFYGYLKKMNFFESKNNLVDFTARFSKLREELDFTHEALQENKEVEKSVCLYDGLVRKGLNFTPMKTMLWVDRSFVWSYSVLNSEELFQLGSLKSQYHATTIWSPWIGADLVSVETIDFLS